MKVAVVTNRCTHYRRPLFERLARRFDVDFFFTSRGREWYASGSDAAPSELHALSVPNAWQLFRLLGTGRYDCVVASVVGRATLLAAWAAATISRTPLIVWTGLWAHPETFFHRVSRPLVRRLLRRSDAVFVYGSHVAQYVRAETGRTEGIIEIAQAVDTEFFAATSGEDGEDIRRCLAAEGEFLACFVGRLEPDKGLEVLFRAAAAAECKPVLALMGTGTAKRHLEELATDLGISERIRFVGHVEQGRLPAYMWAADVLVLPSLSMPRWREPWGLVVNEAMSCSRPVIASTAVGAAAGGLVLHGQTGLVVEEGSVTGLADAIDRLAFDPRECERLGQFARRHVQRWSFDEAADAFERGVRLVAPAGARA